MSRSQPTSARHRILVDLLSIPTAPFAEHQVIDHVQRFCAARGVSTQRDAAGNVLVRVKIGRRTVRRPVCMTAHLDHPGFVAERMVGEGRVRVLAAASRRSISSPAAFASTWRVVGSRVTSARSRPYGEGQERVKTAEIEVDQVIPRRAIGMWDFPDPVIRGGRIYARGCDDLAGGGRCSVRSTSWSAGGQAATPISLFTRGRRSGLSGRSRPAVPRPSRRNASSWPWKPARRGRLPRWERSDPPRRRSFEHVHSGRDRSLP